MYSCISMYVYVHTYTVSTYIGQVSLAKRCFPHACMPRSMKNGIETQHFVVVKSRANMRVRAFTE